MRPQPERPTVYDLQECHAYLVEHTHPKKGPRVGLPFTGTVRIVGGWIDWQETKRDGTLMPSEVILVCPCGNRLVVKRSADPTKCFNCHNKVRVP